VPPTLLARADEVIEFLEGHVSDSQEEWLRRCPFTQQLSNFECKLPNRSEMSRTFLLKEFEQFCFSYPADGCHVPAAFPSILGMANDASDLSDA
jgi:hypothetical protein